MVSGDERASLVDRAGHARAPAFEALRAAARVADLPVEGAELIRLGSNAVFRLPGRTIARLARGVEHESEARRQVAVARWLESVGYPAVQVLGVEQPVVADGYVATFWVSASEDTRYAPIEQVARLVRDLHRLDAPAELGLPAYDPFAVAEQRLGQAEAVEQEDLGHLRDRVAEERKRYAELDFVLPAGVIHGDANVGNVILDRDDQPVLIDLDSFAVGPREWDLIQTALFADRLGWHTADEYRRFVDVYGYDITEWDGYEQLADLREVLMTIWLAGKAHEDPKNAEEVHKRVNAMRTGGSRKDWQPY